jgi:hypothetical protein
MFRLRTIFLLAALWALPFAASALDGPDGTMVLTGSLAPSSDGKVVPAAGDSLALVNVKTNNAEATVTYDGSGAYGVILSKPASFNGTQLILRLSHAGTVYRLLNAAGGDALLVFSGSLFPVNVTINVVASSTVISTTATGGTTTGGGTGTGSGGTGTTAPPPALSGDLNDDGKVDDLDVQLIKQGISGQVSLTTLMDVNKDRVINTRDLIDLIRLVRTQGGTALRQTASSAPVTATVAAPATVVYTRPPTTRDQINAINLARDKEQTTLQPATIIKQSAPVAVAAAPVASTRTRAPTTREQIDAINRAHAKAQTDLKTKSIIPGP